MFACSLHDTHFLKKSLDSTAGIRYNKPRTIAQNVQYCQKHQSVLLKHALLKRRIYMEVYRIHMGKAKCAVDLGDGSERGEYVDQDYILAKMGRPHRSISLMYCYYPLDEGWPGRASVVHASPD